MIKREGIKKGIYILPNLFTTANLFCGFFSVIRAINGDYITAAWAILFAGVFDFMDGLVARVTKSQSEFGFEYDSIVDVASFGMAPAVLMYTWTLFHFHRIGWAAAFVFCACGALRLSRFNVQSSDVEQKTFQGLPIPAGAYLLASFVIFYETYFPAAPAQSIWVVVLTVMAGLLMVSNIPYRSLKSINLRQRANFFALVLLIGLVFVIASAPHVMIFVFAIAYALFGILEEIIRSPRRIRQAKESLSQFFYKDDEEMIDEKEAPLKIVKDHHE